MIYNRSLLTSITDTTWRSSAAASIAQGGLENIDCDRFEVIMSEVNVDAMVAKSCVKEWLKQIQLFDMLTETFVEHIEKDGGQSKGQPTRIKDVTNEQTKVVLESFKDRALLQISEAVHNHKNIVEDFNAKTANDKFATTDGAFVGNFAQIELFFKGLDGYIGLPSHKVYHQMEMEHCFAADSLDTFVTSNYGGTQTNPRLEWEFVVCPVPDKEYPGIIRQADPLEKFLDDPTAALAGLAREEVIAIRLFTGPMFMKYNAKLRQFPAAGVEALKKNGYVTTIHAVVSAIIKLSRTWKIPYDRKVYRGLGGMLLPQEFWKEDPFGCRGGVEFGIMSTTTTREVAIQYSGVEKGRPTIFEIEVGQVDRGAPLRWVSQYPGEDEIVMPPLSNLEVVGDARMESTSKGVVMVIPLRINVNLKSLTMDELQGRRKLLHISMMQNLLAEAHRDLTDVDKEAEALEAQDKTRIKHQIVAKMLKGALSMAFATWCQNTVEHNKGVRKKLTLQEAFVEKEKMLNEFKELVSEMQNKEGEWFNDDNHYKDAMTWSLDTKRGIIRKYREIRGDRFKRFNPEVKARILESKCILWAREGTVYRIISNTKHFPWHAVAEGKIPEVVLRPNLTNEQAVLAWEAIEANYNRFHQADGAEAEGQVVEHVALRGLAGKTVKLEVGQTLMGRSICMQIERTGIDGEVRQQVQGLGPESIRLLLPALRRNRNLTKLDLSRSIVGPELARDLAAILRRTNTDFSSLHIRSPIPLGKARSSNEFTLNRGPSTQYALLMGNRRHGAAGNQDGNSSDRANSVLHAASLRNGYGNDWEPCDVEGGIAIATFLQENNKLQKLDLEGNCIGPEGATALADVISGLTALTSLNLRDNNIGEKGATAISEALQQHGVLVNLDLRDNRMGSQGLASLVPVIEANTCLVNLNNLNIGPAGVSSNSMRVRHMTDPGYEMVFVAFRLRAQACDLTYLDLAENTLGIEGARLLSTALHTCRNLEELDVRSNALRSAGVVIIAGAFPELVKLTSLDLSFNLINTLDANIQVANAVQKLPQLKVLKYLGNIERAINFKMCCPGSYGMEYQVLKRALPNAVITSMTVQQRRWGMLSWMLVIGCIIVFFAMSTVAIYLYNTLSYNLLGYAMAIGTVAILVLVGLFLLIWVLYRRMFARLGITMMLANAMHRRLRFESLPRRRLSMQGNDVELESGDNGMDEFVGDLSGLSESDREEASRILRGDTPAGFRCASIRPLDSRSYEEDERAAAVEEPDEAFQFAMQLDPKIARKVPMLLEQYLLRTAVPGALLFYITHCILHIACYILPIPCCTFDIKYLDLILA